MYVDEFTEIIKGLQDVVSSLHRENRELKKEIDIISEILHAHLPVITKGEINNEHRDT